MNLKSGSVDCFEQFSQFESLNEFNRHFEKWMLEKKGDFSKGELMGLKRLVRFAAKVPGVSNAKIGTVLKAIYEEYGDCGISRSTFKRMIKKAVNMGMLTVHETVRKNGSQTSNLYVFNRFPTNEPPKEEKLNHPNKTINLSETKIKGNTLRNVTSKQLDHTYVSNRIPKRFVQLVKCYFDNAKVIEEYWKMTQIAAYRGECEKKADFVLETAIDAFKQLIRKIKFTNRVQNPIGYFYGIVTKKFNELYVKDLKELREELNIPHYATLPPWLIIMESAGL